MSGSGGVSIARSAIRGDNRFYNPPAMRRMQQQLREKQQREEEEEEGMLVVVDKELSSASMPPPPPPRLRKAQSRSKNRVVVSGSEVSVGSSGSSGSGTGRSRSDGSNLDRFLEHTTPLVHPRLLPMRSRCESECRTYFVLEDLWESFAEWSAYGAGVPLHMHGSDSTVQYYVPYLSGIQLYVLDPLKNARNPGEDTEVSSEGSSSNSRLDKLPNHAKTLENAVDSSVSELNRVSLGDHSITGSLSSGETEISSPHGRLLFEYLEYEPPFGREPLANKIVSSYPDCRKLAGIPYSVLSICIEAGSMGCGDTKQSMKLPLPTFGLASYKLKVSVWNQNRAQESQKLSSLQQAAGKWLKRLQVDHPDYMFFTSNGHK
ncbi:hypothetical protein Bca101_013939 [Brassica carinata]